MNRKLHIALVSLLCLPLLYFAFIGLKHLAGARELYLEGGTAAGEAVRLADLENRSIKESSGIAASRRNKDVFWTHNDSGDGPFIYAFDRQGKHRGVWRIAGAEAEDWEDMAVGPGPKQGSSYLYIGDIGDNSRKRAQITVYRVAEPQVDSKDSSSTTKKPLATEAADVLRLRYPDGKHDAETLLVHPSTGDLYIVTKARGSAARVFKLGASSARQGEFVLEFVAEFRFPNQFQGFITGGAISPDGRRVVICDYLEACELVLTQKPGAPFDDIWKQTPVTLAIGGFGGIRRQGEAICYRADGRAVLATSEGVPCPLIEFTLADKP